MIDALTGLRCTFVRRFHHQFADEPPSETGPLELAWDDGTVLTLDADTDWTLHVSGQPWVDPYASVSGRELEALAREVGLWHEAKVPTSLARLVGQTVTSSEPLLDEMGDLTGLSLAFETQVVTARVEGGQLTVEVVER